MREEEKRLSAEKFEGVEGDVGTQGLWNLERDDATKTLRGGREEEEGETEEIGVSLWVPTLSEK